MIRHALAILAIALAFGFVATATAAETLPAAPTSYVNDYAGILNRGTAAQLNQQLQQFERETSNQLVIAIFQKMPDGVAIEDYTQRVADYWKVGTKGQNNGIVLFVFVQDRQMFIQVGYGLEGALPDALAKQIIENEIVPRFRSGDYTGGVSAGATAIMQATKGEYKGTGRTVGGRGGGPNQRQAQGSALCVLFAIIIFFGIMARLGRRRGVGYGGVGPFIVGGLLGSQMGRHHRSGGFGGFGGGGGGFGGFSGGGGSFGGGGAGGRW